MEVSLLLAEVDKKYGSCKSYEDRINITCDTAYVMNSSFSTKYLSPDELIFRAWKPDSKDKSHVPNVDYFIKGRKVRVVMDDTSMLEFPYIPSFDKNIDWKNLDRSYAFKVMSGISFGASKFTHPLLMRGTRTPLWTKQNDFRTIGKKDLNGITCHVIRSVSSPVLIWICVKDFSIRRVEMGAGILNSAFNNFYSFVGNLADPFWKPEFFKMVDEATLETVCTFENIKFNSLSSDDMNFG